VRQFWFDMRWIAASVATWAENLGYAIRPYDMLADRRRWFWQRRQPCGRSPEAVAMSRDLAVRRLAAGLDVPGRLLKTAVPNQYTELFATFQRAKFALLRTGQLQPWFAGPAILCGYPAPVIDEHAVLGGGWWTDALGAPLRCTRMAGHETVDTDPDRLNHTNPARPDWAWRTRKERSMNLNELAARIHVISRSKGFWEGERNPAAVLMLIVSEAVEALEEIRDGRPLNEAHTAWTYRPGSDGMLRLGLHRIESAPGGPEMLVEQVGGFERRTPMTPEKWIELGYKAKPEGVPSEMADILIRVLDACCAWDIDIDAAVAEKMAYNEGRPHLHGRAGGM
jgi:NTP pyrophosphatase (non-canonical NTP hydrolase)